MSDIINKINEAIGSPKLLKSIEWSRIVEDFIYTYNDMKRLSSNKKNKKAQIATMAAENMLKNLQSFIDDFPEFEKLVEAARKESERLNNVR